MLRRSQIPDIINSHKLLKDLSKEVRHAERFLISLNPPKPERESKRKRKRPVNKDFVDFSHPQKLYEVITHFKTYILNLNYRNFRIHTTPRYQMKKVQIKKL